MKEINDNELENIKGGVSPWAIIGVASFVIFFLGVVDGSPI